LLNAPQNYLSRTLVVEILEPLSGPATLSQLATTDYGQVEVQIPDASGAELYLVPSSFRPEDPGRYHQKFDRVLEAPIRVKGELLSDEEMAKSLHRPYYVIRVSSWEPIAREAATPVHSLAELKSNPAQWDRRRIVYEGIYENRFEVSALDKEIWLGFERNAELVGKPSEPSNGARINHVRVTGLLFAKAGARYGHLGGYPFELIASRVEFLGPATPP